MNGRRLTAALLALAGPLAAPSFPQPAHAQRELEVPYVPTPQPVVDKMLAMAAVGPDDYVVDLGSGDGRIAVTAGKLGARALGVDLDAELIERAVWNAKEAGVAGKVRFRRQDLFETPIREASVLTLYLLPDVNLRLRPRILTELRPGSRVVSHAFHMGDWNADRTEEVNGAIVRLWIVPAPVGGTWAWAGADGTPMLLTLEQKFQEVTGRLSGDASAHSLNEVVLAGDRLSFVIGTGPDARRYTGRARDNVIEPAEGSAGGWLATRID